jgi:hypothetical protein
MPEVRQVVSEESVRQVAEDLSQELKVAREFFRSTSIPERTGSTYDIPVPEDNLGEPEGREPGSEITFGREDYRVKTLERQEFALGSQLTEEALNDSSFELISDHIDRHAENMAQKLDREAFKVLDAAAREPAPEDDEPLPAGSDNGDLMTFEDVVNADKILSSRESGYSADALMLGTEAKEGIVTDLSDRGTDLGDATIESGQVIAQYAGVDILFSNNDLLTDNDAILADTDYFGYEGEWLPVSSDSESDFTTKTERITTRWKGDWIATQPDAAIRLRG